MTVRTDVKVCIVKDYVMDVTETGIISTSDFTIIPDRMKPTISDTISQVDVYDTLLAHIPAGVAIRSINAKHLRIATKTLKGSITTEIPATKFPSPICDPNDVTLSGSTSGGGQITVTQALLHVGDYAATPSNVTNHEGVIGVQVKNGKTEARGTTKDLPGMTFAITMCKPSSALTSAYIRGLYLLTQTCNDAIFFGTFAKGELRYKGANFNAKYNAKASITHTFFGSPNIANGTELGGIEVEAIVYGAADYIGFERGDEDDGNDNVISKVLCLHHDRLYPLEDWTNLLS